MVLQRFHIISREGECQTLNTAHTKAPHPVSLITLKDSINTWAQMTKAVNK